MTHILWERLFLIESPFSQPRYLRVAGPLYIGPAARKPGTRNLKSLILFLSETLLVSDRWPYQNLEISGFFLFQVGFWVKFQIYSLRAIFFLSGYLILFNISVSGADFPKKLHWNYSALFSSIGLV